MPRGNMSMLSGVRKLPLLCVLASLTLITASLYWACVFRSKPATDSGRSLPLIPIETCH
jgi:hypothetical protein